MTPESRKPKDRAAWYALAGAVAIWAVLTTWLVSREIPHVTITTPRPGMAAMPTRPLHGSGFFDAAVLNQQAWDVVSASSATAEDIKLALALAERANQLADGQDHNILDTLARAHFRAKNISLALSFQRQAIEALRRSGEEPTGSNADFAARLKEYESAKS